VVFCFVYFLNHIQYFLIPPIPYLGNLLSKIMCVHCVRQINQHCKLHCLLVLRFSYTSLRIENTVLSYLHFSSYKYFSYLLYSFHKDDFFELPDFLLASYLFRCHINNNASYTVSSCPIRHGGKLPHDSVRSTFGSNQFVCRSSFRLTKGSPHFRV
jgi:hypothetical protein